MFQHLLVPLDGSSCAEQALPIAARIAHASGGMVHLVRVVCPLVDYSGGLSPVSQAIEEVIEAETADAATYLQTQASLPLLENIKTRIEVSFGQPTSSIPEAVKIQGIDLLVICSHGRTGFIHWVLGSVARTLVHHCTIPILVLHQNEATASLLQSSPICPLRTLVPLDGSALAEAALVPAASLTSALAAPMQGALHLSQVVKPIPTTAAKGSMSDLNAETLQRTSAYLSQREEHLRAETPDLKLSLTHSVELNPDVASALQNLAEHGKEGGIDACNMIAISTHARGGLERLMLGSITERLLTATKLPLLIVRLPGQKSA